MHVSGVLFLGRSFECPFVAHLKIANWIVEYPFRVNTHWTTSKFLHIGIFDDHSQIPNSLGTLITTNTIARAYNHHNYTITYMYSSTTSKHTQHTKVHTLE